MATRRVASMLKNFFCDNCFVNRFLSSGSSQRGPTNKETVLHPFIVPFCPEAFLELDD